MKTFVTGLAIGGVFGLSFLVGMAAGMWSRRNDAVVYPSLHERVYPDNTTDLPETEAEDMRNAEPGSLPVPNGKDRI